MSEQSILQIIEFLGSATVFSAAIAYLGKKAIEAYLAGRVEAYKSNLEKIANEHSIRFQRLHSERAEVIKEFYERLAVLDDVLYSVLRPFQANGEPELKQKVQHLGNTFNELRNYYLPKRIYFEEEVCSLIDQILETAKGVFYDITTVPVDTSNLDYRYDKNLLQERHSFWEKARNIHRQELSVLKMKLEREFRNILGINA